MLSSEHMNCKRKGDHEVQKITNLMEAWDEIMRTSINMAGAIPGGVVLKIFKISKLLKQRLMSYKTLKTTVTLTEHKIIGNKTSRQKVQTNMLTCRCR